ncbi:MAG TPA: fimbria/pilus periplasmic chaperone [Verrucomicrobiae bacterium]|nr:fimbria/pilus periplasmic chaperone [Verrucomicrobiae bacterium]
MWIGWTAAAIAAAGWFGVARAADFSILPTTITLSNQPAADVSLTNTGTTFTRISVHAYAWSQEPSLPEKLTESDDVVYFPEIFALAPGGTQRIRVGSALGPTDKEQAYRLIIQELPTPKAPGGPPSFGVTFLSRVDMPVFVSPRGPQTRVPKLVSLAVEHGVATALLANEGTIHIRQSVLTFTGTDAAGNAIWHETVRPFYVLAGSQQNAHATIPAAICARLHGISAHWVLPDNLGQLAASSGIGSCR